MRQISATSASERGGWSRRESPESGRWDDYDALAAGSFLTALATRMGTSAWDLLQDRPLPLAAPVPRRPDPEPADATLLHTRLMPAGWRDRASFAEFNPGSLFTFAG